MDRTRGGSFSLPEASRGNIDRAVSFGSVGSGVSFRPSKNLAGSPADERTPLIGPLHATSGLSERKDVEAGVKSKPKGNTFQKLSREAGHRVGKTAALLTTPKQWSARAVWNKGVLLPVSLLPCVFLGVLLNVLDALSYGMILFPLGEEIFAETGADGISMFYVSCIVSQLVYTCGGSIFKGGVGSEMIEVVPFFHKMAFTIMDSVGRDKPNVVMATTITSFAMSAVVTGAVFGLLGAFRLGSLVNFFPRHILIGCIGGVGFFLFVTGIEVSARLDGNLEYNLDTAKKLVESDTVLLWTIPLLLSIALLVLKHFIRSPFLVPGFFILVAGVFYIVVTAVPALTVEGLRDLGWVFPSPGKGVPFYHFYSYYDFGAVDWEALLETVPAMFALTFFGILHVPINVPALAIAAGEDDLNLNRELVAHGLSNALSGFCGSIQNYLVYVNSEMFISNGGNTRLAGLLLAAATSGVLFAGPTMIGFVPIMVVGALIFYLGIELLQEALWDTLGKMNKLEYLTVLAIVLTMGIYDFVGGVLVGIVLACLNFVVLTSRKSVIRANYSGQIVESTVRRHPVQRLYLHEVGSQIYVTKLAGMLFFGSIVAVEKNSRAMIEDDFFSAEPIRYLIFDFAHVNGIDYSAAEAFPRIARILRRRDVRMLISGVHRHDDVGKSLHSVGLWSDDSSVMFFEDLNVALEYCENQLLTSFYAQQPRDPTPSSPSYLDIPARPDPGNTFRKGSLSLSMASPRQQGLHKAARNTLSTQRDALPHKTWSALKEPLPLLLHTFQALSDKGEDFWFRALPYFTREEYARGAVLFARGDSADGFFLLKSGVLRATYALPVGGYHESIVAGTSCGELPFFSATERTATVCADKDCVVWALREDSWRALRAEWHEGAEELLTIALRLTKERVDAVTSYVLTTAG